MNDSKRNQIPPVAEEPAKQYASEKREYGQNWIGQMRQPEQKRGGDNRAAAAHNGFKSQKKY